MSKKFRIYELHPSHRFVVSLALTKCWNKGKMQTWSHAPKPPFGASLDFGFDSGNDSSRLFARLSVSSFLGVAKTFSLSDIILQTIARNPYRRANKRNIKVRYQPNTKSESNDMWCVMSEWVWDTIEVLGVYVSTSLSKVQVGRQTSEKKIQCGREDWPLIYHPDLPVKIHRQACVTDPHKAQPYQSDSHKALDGAAATDKEDIVHAWNFLRIGC